MREPVVVNCPLLSTIKHLLEQDFIQLYVDNSLLDEEFEDKKVLDWSIVNITCAKCMQTLEIRFPGPDINIKKWNLEENNHE